MSEPSRAEDPLAAEPEVVDAEPVAEVVDGETVPEGGVLAEVRPLPPQPRPGGSALAARTPRPIVQAAAVAATGFVAGAATVALVRRHAGRKLARAQRLAPRRPLEMLPIASSRTFLVDVHVIAKPGE